MTSPIHDFAVIGAGIAGASVAAELSKTASVILLEMEPQPGYHTTSRSAAILAPGYGVAPVRALVGASVPFLLHPPADFSRSPLTTGPRPILTISRKDQLEVLDRLHAELSRESNVSRLDASEVHRKAPLLRPGYAAGGLLDPQGHDLDVHALHSGYLTMFTTNGGRLETGARVASLKQTDGVWEIGTSGGSWKAATVVNAAGAWAEQIGRLAGAEVIGLVAKRRTALTIGVPEGLQTDRLPFVVDVQEQFYLKPDAGQLLISPANEDPMPPCDVQPEDLDVAICVDRIERAFDLTISRIASKWAGLRSFVADGCPVIGYSEQSPRFFWLAGQGGNGIQTAPAAARLAASLVLRHDIPADIREQELNIRSLSPARPGIG